MPFGGDKAARAKRVQLVLVLEGAAVVRVQACRHEEFHRRLLSRGHRAKHSLPGQTVGCLQGDVDCTRSFRRS